VRDPSGNSYIENICAPKEDPQIKVEQYDRTEEDDEFLGLAKPLLEPSGDEEPPKEEKEPENDFENEENCELSDLDHFFFYLLHNPEIHNGIFQSKEE